MDPVVTVAGGRVRGVWREDLWSFSGIPYAQAPTGDLRWRPPRPPLPWQGVRDATSFGPIAPQRLADPRADQAQSEDCLTLNIWTPEIPENPTPAAGKGRPVMVWIHGGGFTSGSGSVFLYRGGHLARRGDVVVVTINYRLGALGWLGHSGVSGADGFIGNWGLHDQVAALQWVRDHIGAFGGDRDLVTVFGESAGGFSIAALMATPSAAGLFRRAIVQSGGPHVHSLAQAEDAAARLATTLGLSDCTRATLGSVPAADLVAATEVMAKARPDPGSISVPFLPVVDGVFLPRDPLRAVELGGARDVDLLIGTNRDELTLFALGRPELRTSDDAGARRWVANAAPDIPTDELMEAYRAARLQRGEGVDPQALMVAIGSDGVFRWPSLQMAAAQCAQGAPTFVYLFEWESPAFGGLLGSCHALELPFVFGVVHVPVVQMFTGSGDEAEALSAHMQQAWLAFARHGDPSQGVPGDSWRNWDPSSRSTMVFGRQSGVADGPRNAELSVWERHRPLITSSDI